MLVPSDWEPGWMSCYFSEDCFGAAQISHRSAAPVVGVTEGKVHSRFLEPVWLIPHARNWDRR